MLSRGGLQAPTLALLSPTLDRDGFMHLPRAQCSDSLTQKGPALGLRLYYCVLKFFPNFVTSGPVFLFDPRPHKPYSSPALEGSYPNSYSIVGLNL